MPSLHRMDLIEPDLRPLLAPDERIGTLEVIASALVGADRLEAPAASSPGQAQELTGWRRVAGGTLGAGLGLATGLGPMIGGNALDAAAEGIGGVSASGGAGSWAARADAAVRRAGHARMLVTDRRLLLLDQTGSGMRDNPAEPGRRRVATDFAVLLDVPRASLASARPASKALQRGRLELLFSDGSTIAVMTGVLSTSPARRILSALAG